MSNPSELDALIESLDPISRTYFAEVDLGLKAREFSESDLGRYIIGCAHHEIAEAHQLLKRTLPFRWRRIQELQNRIWRAESLLLWLRDLIAAGQSASQALEEHEHVD